MTEPLGYWRTRGRTYERDFRPERFVAQEAALVDVLRPLRFASVLDVGCGFGRIGELLFELKPDLRTYVGVDISPDQLAAAQRRLGPRARLVSGDIRELDERPADLVIASEVLMHVPPTDIMSLVERLRGLARRHLVTVDWDAPGKEAGGYCWGHDYATLLPGARKVPVGRQAIWVL
ncbi:MAG: class I SAM-dependent methyltransferase [Chloroflexota bacterium]